MDHPVARSKSQKVQFFTMKSTRQGSNDDELLYHKYTWCKAKRQRVQWDPQMVQLHPLHPPCYGPGTHYSLTQAWSVGTRFLTVSLATSCHTMPDHVKTKSPRYIALLHRSSVYVRLNYRYVKCVRFSLLSFLVFDPPFLDDGSVYRYSSYDYHCSRTVSNELMHALLTDIVFLLLLTLTFFYFYF